MEKDFSFFAECVSGRKVDPSMMRTEIKAMNLTATEVRLREANLSCYGKDILFGNCEAATPCYPAGYKDLQKGNNPMRIDNTTATAYVTSEKSDSTISREWLLKRLSEYEGWRNPKIAELRKLFNMDAKYVPGTAKALIDAIKNDKFKMDQKKLDYLTDEMEQSNRFDTAEDYMEEYGYSPFYAMIFTDLPKSDEKGYVTALDDFSKALKATKDTIMVKSPDDGLAALQALDAWVPAGKAN